MTGGQTDRVEESLVEWLQSAGYKESRTIEKFMEHVFLAEVLQECWFRRRQVVEVLHAEVDAAGYDLILQTEHVVRHVQLKATRKGSKTQRQIINRKLSAREGGCVVWTTYAIDEETFRTRLTYRWWDGTQKELPDRPARHTRGPKAIRPGTALLTRGDFETVATTAELVDMLFPKDGLPPRGARR